MMGSERFLCTVCEKASLKRHLKVHSNKNERGNEGVGSLRRTRFGCWQREEEENGSLSLSKSGGND